MLSGAIALAGGSDGTVARDELDSTTPESSTTPSAATAGTEDFMGIPPLEGEVQSLYRGRVSGQETMGLSNVAYVRCGRSHSPPLPNHLRSAFAAASLASFTSARFAMSPTSTPTRSASIGP